MYKDRFVTAVKVGGKILREREGVVFLPFGCEYSLLLKNLESRRASVKVYIDGNGVMGERSLIVEPNASIELERFVESLEHGNKFKFIQKTKEIMEHRGDRIDDGIVRVEFAFEQVTRHVNMVEHTDRCHHHHHTYWPHYPHPCYPNSWGHPWITWTSTGGPAVTAYYSSGSAAVGAQTDTSAVVYFANQSSPLPDEGITVKGSESQQRFHESSIGTLDQSEVIIIRLRGEGSTGKSVDIPVTVKDKVRCETCGKMSDSVALFCSRCGTAIDRNAVKYSLI